MYMEIWIGQRDYVGNWLNIKSKRKKEIMFLPVQKALNIM